MNSRSRVEAQATSGDAFTRLINGVRAQYPLITDPESAKPYFKGDLHHASIRFETNTHPRGISEEVFAVALQRAADTQSVTFAGHGARKHSTFEESLGLLGEALGEHTLSLRTQAIFATPRDGRKIPSQRVLAVAPERDRISYVPQLRLKAEAAVEKARTAPNPRGVLDQAIQTTANEAGIGPALIQAIYQDMHPSDLERTFADSFQRKGIAHSPGTVPHPKMTQSQRDRYYKVASEVNDALTIRSDGRVRSSIAPGAHTRALEILEQAGWLRSHAEIKDVVGFEPTVRRVIPLAVILTPHEIAARAAGADDIQPYLSNALDRSLGDQMTTQVITAYLKH